LPISSDHRSIDPSFPRCLVIAEVAQNHDGSLGTAHSYIDAVARTGADAVKFQTHIADAESTPGEPWRVKFSRQDATRYEYWRRMEFTAEQWAGLAEHAAEAGLLFLSSAFSIEAVELLDRIGVPAWKVGAGEITNLPMIRRMATTGKPVLLSSGMSGWTDLDRAVENVRNSAAPVAVLQCTTMYPCPPGQLGLNVLNDLRDRYGCPVGLSDHSGGIYAGLAAVTLGASIVEVHVCLSRECFGPDIAASVTTAELTQLVSGIRYIEEALANPVDKDAAAEGLADLRRAFTKSVVARCDLPTGHFLVETDLAVKKPGTGIPPFRLEYVLHKRLKQAVSANEPIMEHNVE
jgi:N-acetylneuraminate synthase